MAYFVPYIDAAGLHIPTYTDIRDDLIGEARSIFGQDIYLDNDSMDYQWISTVALKISDTLQAVQLAYNNRSPVTAVGAGLDGVIKLNAMSRKAPSYSSCVVILTGDEGTVISGGIVRDASRFLWSLPNTVTIGSGGTVSVSAVCQTLGAITAMPGDISEIVTPTKGWISVTNAVAAVPGQPVETDAAVRARQSVSVALPSRTVLAGTTGGIASVPGVTRYRVYENDTNITDADGLPPHSVTAVVEGGADADIAQEIFMRKGIGAYTNGDVEVTIIDLYGQPNIIRFYRPVYVPIFVTVTLKALPGYSPSTSSQVKTALVAYLNSLQIGDDLTISSLWGAALAIIPDLSVPIFSITALTAGKSLGTQGTTDIGTTFNEVTQGLAANVVVHVI